MPLTRSLLIAGLMGLVGVGAYAQDVAASDDSATPLTEVPVDPLAPRAATDIDLSDFLWTHRPLIVFADTPADPRFQEQMALLAERPAALLERDVVIIFDTDPAAQSAIRTELRPRGFAVIVLQKDGTVGFRRPAPRDVRELTRGIDNFALRQEELRQGG